MSHLEDLLFQWYDWRGYILKRNIKVGRLSHGGWEAELDIVAYHPNSRELVHLEPSLDSDPWPKREHRFSKKFECGKKFIYTEVFPWLNRQTPLQQIAVLTSRNKSRVMLAGAKIVTVDELIQQIKNRVLQEGRLGRNAIPEQYNLLRTAQLFLCGYRPNKN